MVQALKSGWIIAECTINVTHLRKNRRTLLFADNKRRQMCKASNVVFALFSKTKMAQYKGAAREGQRAAHLMKKREKQKEELELLKKKISDVCC